MVPRIRLTLMLLLLTVVLVCLLNKCDIETFAGEANDWGGAPKTEDPKAQAQCEQRIKEFQAKWDKEAGSRGDNAAAAAKSKKLQDQDKERGYQDQLQMMNDNTKDAEKKKATAERKLVEVKKQEEDCQVNLAKELQKLVQPKTCCDQMAKEKDEAIKRNQAEKQRASKLQESNYTLGPQVSNLESLYKKLMVDANRCEMLNTDLRYQNEELKKDVARKNQT